MNSAQNLILRYFEYLFLDTSTLVYSTPERLIKPDSQALLLDCGCGQGLYTKKIANRLGTSQIIGIEINLPLALQAKNNGVKILLADLNSLLPFKNDSFQVITAFNVLEHLIETEIFLQEMYRLLRPGGYVIIDTPNLASWHNIAALFAGLQPFSGPNINSMTESDVTIVRRMHRRAHGISEEDEYYQSNERERHRHIVVVASRSLLKAVQRTGFVVDKIIGFGYYPFPPPLSRIMSRLDPWHSHHVLIKANKSTNNTK